VGFLVRVGDNTRLKNGANIQMSEISKTAIILANLGTPDEPTPSAVRRYLREFLSDQRVVEGKGPRRLLWLAVLNSIVLTFRPKKVAKLYASIWEQDSPMRRILDEQVAALQRSLSLKHVNPPDVFSGMTYGQPGLTPRLQELAGKGYQHILIIPMYPQYSATTTAPIYDQVAKFQLGRREVVDIRIVKSYFNHPLYIQALAGSVRQHRQVSPGAEKLILSYHGIPKEYADKGDPYPQQCHETSRMLARVLDLKDGEWMTTFQSRFGPAEWLQPYTDKTLEKIAGEGVKNIDVVCPAFTADCLGTLEEIAEENKEVFESAGGEHYHYIPALNSAGCFINVLSALVNEQAGDWLSKSDLHNEASHGA
jgi:ferrochelatase